MRDHLFEHQKSLEDSHLLKYAEKMGLDVDRFRNNLLEQLYNAKQKKALHLVCPTSMR
jgi:predicted DsbA family dithiol-disulfide isomerase